MQPVVSNTLRMEESRPRTEAAERGETAEEEGTGKTGTENRYCTDAKEQRDVPSGRGAREWVINGAATFRSPPERDRELASPNPSDPSILAFRLAGRLEMKFVQQPVDDRHEEKSDRGEEDDPAEQRV